MKTLIIDWGRNDTYFYVKDMPERTIRKSRKFEGNLSEIAEKTIGIIKSYPDIKIIELDKASYGVMIAELIREKLDQFMLNNIQVVEYKYMAM